MGRLSALAAALAPALVLVSAAPAAGGPLREDAHQTRLEPVADPIRQWHAEIAQAARRFGLPSDWIVRVMRAESGGRTKLDGRPITSPKGAMGLMQLMPATWREARLALGLGSDPHDPADNILAGAWYLRRMYDRFGYPGLFGAYNAGPGRYAAYLAGRSTLPRETQNYLARVAGDEAAAGKPAAAALPTRGLFFSLGEAAPPDLFVVRKVAATVGPSAAVPNAQKPER